MLRQKLALQNNSTIQVFPLSLSKGLEFDHVILYLSKKQAHTTWEKKRMYNAISRAMKTIVLSQRLETDNCK